MKLYASSLKATAAVSVLSSRDCQIWALLAASQRSNRLTLCVSGSINYVIVFVPSRCVVSTFQRSTRSRPEEKSVSALSPFGLQVY